MAVSLAPRIARILPALACPGCGGGLQAMESGLGCANCGAAYPVRDGRVYFREPASAGDAMDALKGRLKRLFGRWYYAVGVRILGPTYPFPFGARVRRTLDCARGIVVDAGCGSERCNPDAIGLDLYDYAAVDLVCDLESLPFKPASVDAFVTRSVLEHVPDAGRVVEGFRRCTRAGGAGLHQIPFLYPFHASPHDYRRFTHMGVRRLFSGWTVRELINAAGPFTLFLVLFAELAATAVSLGMPRIKALAYLACCALLFPLKFLDAPFIGRRAMLPFAPSIFVHVVKPESRP